MELADGSVFIAEKILRIIPKRRLVAFGMWQDKSVVAKIFFDPHRANKHIKKEIMGIHILKNNNIPTPALWYEGKSADNTCQVLLLQRIVNASNLETIWQEKKSISEFMPFLRAMMFELAIQHVLGVLQHDAHFNNFLLTEKMIYTLDGAQIELFPKKLSKKNSINNIALFLSQLGVGVEEYQEILFRYYAKARGWLLKPQDIRHLFNSIKKWSDIRWQRYEKKIFRESTHFSVLKGWGKMGIYDRHYMAPEFWTFIQHPESAYQHQSAEILKAGRSSTVIKVTLDGRELVVKRYNMKNIFHHGRRCLRPTRAMQAWRVAQKLKLFRIPTAPPVAFVEHRYLGFRGKSYYVTEYIAGGHVGHFLQRFHANDIKISAMIKRVSLLLKNLFKAGITHGDLKMTNILLDSQEEPCLIDLDGTKQHRSYFQLRKSWHKEIKRFLHNFYSQPVLEEKFKSELN